MTAGSQQWQPIVPWLLATTLIAETATIACRVVLGQTAAEFNASGPPLLLQIHHMFWAVPLFAVAAVLRGRRRVAAALWGIGLGLVASDLAHHFVVLPLWQGNTGWHWP